MPSIFLANPPHALEERYGALAPAGATLPQLGLLWLAASLRSRGHRVRVVDAPALGLSERDVVAEAQAFGPDLVGLTAVTPTVKRAARLASALAAAQVSAPVVLGGSHVSAAPARTLSENESIALGLVGEGELALPRLVEALSSGCSPSTVPGLVHREGGEIVVNPRPDPIEDLDSLPMPAWDLLERFPHAYRPAVFRYDRLPSTHLITSRGCPLPCSFCDSSVLGSRMRSHSVDYILEMLEHLRLRFGVREIAFEDDQLLARPARVVELCERLLDSDARLSWSCNAHAATVRDPALLALMKAAGCRQICFGIESGDEEVLAQARKGASPDDVERAVRATRDAGMEAVGFFILGLPKETRASIERTMKLALKLPLSDVNVFSFTPFPGSPASKDCERHGRVVSDSEVMNVLEPVFVPNGLTARDLVVAQRRLAARFYLRPSVVGRYSLRLAKRPKDAKVLLAALLGFVRFVAQRGRS